MFTIFKPKYGFWLLAVIVSLQLNACKEKTKTKHIAPIEIKFTKEGRLTLYKGQTDSIIAQLDIEIADDDYQRGTGLMYRDHMEASQGMLFVFPDENYRSFYMKNTKIPLDIIYLDSKKTIVNIQKNAQPFNETSLPSSGPAQYVLEINAGLSDTWGLEPGDLAKF